MRERVRAAKEGTHVATTKNVQQTIDDLPGDATLRRTGQMELVLHNADAEFFILLTSGNRRTRRWRESVRDSRWRHEIYHDARTDLDHNKGGNSPGHSSVQTNQRIYG